MRQGFAAIALAFSLMGAGCANVALTQDAGMARILVGSLNDSSRQVIPVEKVSPLYAQYGWLAAKAYNDGLYGLKTEHKAGVDECAGEKDCPAIKRKIAKLESIWGKKPILTAINDCSDEAKTQARRDFGHDGVRGHCSENDPARHRILDGLGIQIWARQGPGCQEMVIAFRGTDVANSFRHSFNNSN